MKGGLSMFTQNEHMWGLGIYNILQTWMRQK